MLGLELIWGAALQLKRRTLDLAAGAASSQSGGTMGSRWFGRGWFVSALTLALGVPCSVFAGIAIALGLGMTVGRLLPERAMTFIWLCGFILSSVAVWFMVRRRARTGSWRTIALGLAGAGVIALGSYALGAVTQSVAPGDNQMGGLAWIVFGYASGIAVLVAAVLGAIAVRLEAADTRATCTRQV